MSDFKEYLNKQLEDSEFRKEWEDSEQEYNSINAIVKSSKENGLPQKKK